MRPGREYRAMIAQFLDTAIIGLLVALVALPATMALIKTTRVRLARRRSARARLDQTLRAASPAAKPAAPPPPREREANLVYRRLRASAQNAGRTKPGDRVPSHREAPPRG